MYASHFGAFFAFSSLQIVQMCSYCRSHIECTRVQTWLWFTHLCQSSLLRYASCMTRWWNIARVTKDQIGLFVCIHVTLASKAPILRYAKPDPHVIHCFISQTIRFPKVACGWVFCFPKSLVPDRKVGSLIPYVDILPNSSFGLLQTWFIFGGVGIAVDVMGWKCTTQVGQMWRLDI